MPEEFTIRIFYNREEDRPILQQYCVILCREVKVRRTIFLFNYQIHMHVFSTS